MEIMDKMNVNEEDMLFSDSGDTQTIVEIPQEVRKINTQAYDKSISDIVRMIEEGDIILDPEFQRNYVWDNKKASSLIESVILNVPIPVIYVSQEKDDRWTVIDGLQRLWSLKRFFGGKFKLSGLEILTDLNKQDYSTLNPKALRMLKNGLLRIIMISQDSNEEIKYDVFMRLNSGSVHLTEQELRNCLYRGSLNKLLKDLSSNQKWLSLLGLQTAHKRMADREMILRYFAIADNWNPKSCEVDGYKGRMKTFLNEYMFKNKNIMDGDVKRLKQIFDETVNKVYDVFGVDAFRKIGDNVNKSINRAVADVLMLTCTQYGYAELIVRKQKITNKFYSLVQEDVEFKNSLLLGTSDKKVLNKRLEVWSRELSLLMSE